MNNVTDEPQNETNVTPEPVNKEITKSNSEPQVSSQHVQSSNVQKQVTKTHIIKRARDNKVISEGNVLPLEGLNKLYDSDFTNGHLLVYFDGKLIFNEVTGNDLSMSIFEINDNSLGEHELKVEFTDNEDNPDSKTNTFKEKIIIE